MKAHIITIGNEILIGDIINTNASWLGEQLILAGFEIHGVSSVGDVEATILDVFSNVQERCDLVIVTGGLGPTHDDITKKAFQTHFNVGLRRDNSVLEFVQNYFNRRGIPFSDSNYMQADVLANCEVLFNYWGSAPGMWVKNDYCYWAILPGVPSEMKNLFTNAVIEKVKQVFPVNKFIKSAYLSVAGIGESTLSDTKLQSVHPLLDSTTTLAYLPHHDGITLRITAIGDHENDVDARLANLKSTIKYLAGEFIFSDSQQSLAAVVGQLLDAQNFTIATAESCTGGGVAFELTQTPGCSSYMKGSIVAYSNEVKMKQLFVKPETLQQFGAVSAQTAMEMAIGVRKQLGTDVGLSITGIAGPGGGTEEKPVGLIWFGVSTPATQFTFKAMLSRDRELNRKRSIMISLDALRRTLLGIESLPYNAEKVIPN